MNLYTDPYAYLRAASGHDTSTVIANLTRIASPVTAGTTSIALIVPISSVLNAYDQVTIFDGSSSEVATVTATANQGATSISVQALQYAHAAGTPMCGDGAQGSLASMIATASTEIESYCRQSLLAASYGNERLPLRSMRASVTRDYTLVICPMHAPVQSVSSLSLQVNGTTTSSLDATQALIDAATGSQIVTVTQMASVSAAAPPVRPTTPGFVLISYTAGAYTAATLPGDVRQACIWLVSDLLSDRRNPTGATDLRYGDVTISTRQPREKRGRGSSLAIRAYEILERYRQRAM